MPADVVEDRTDLARRTARARTRVVLTLPTAAVLLTGLLVAPTHADAVRTLSGPGTDDPVVFLTFVDCTDLFTPGTPPVSRINLGPYDAPMGRRSLGLVPAAPGTASGPVVRFGSLASLSSSFAVASTAGSTGVSYVVVLTPDTPASAVWLGRAALSASGGGWAQVAPPTLSYDWTLVDVAAHAAVGAGGRATPAEFAAAHGDGQGLVVSGFGCDGGAFNLDAVQGAGSTFDFEGIALDTSVAVDRTTVVAGDAVDVSGRVTDGSGRTTGDPLVLESRTPGGAWEAASDEVLSGADGFAHATVTVPETTELRWHRPESQYADEGWSDVVVVSVAPAA